MSGRSIATQVAASLILVVVGPFAAATVGEAEETLALHHDGDIVQYRVRDGSVDYLVEYRWGQAQDAALSGGATERLRVLVETAWRDEDGERRVYYIAPDGGVVASAGGPVTYSTSEIAVSVYRGSVTYTLGGQPVSTHTLSYNETVTRLHEGRPLCGLTTPPPAEPTTIGCEDAEFPFLGTTRPWFTAPRVEWSRGTPFARSYSFEDGLEATLVGYATEGDPIQWTEPDAHPPLPDVAFARRTTIGPDATGFEADYSLAEAAAHVSDQPCFSDWEKTHPRAYLAEARMFIVDHGPEYELESAWSLVFTAGGRDAIYLFLQTSESPIPMGVNGVIGDPEGGATVFCDARPGPLRPEPDQLPRTLPTVASMTAAWERRNAGYPATVWGFKIGCDETCKAVDASVWAGTAIITETRGFAHPYVGPMGTVWSGSIDLIGVDGTGSSHYLFSSTMTGEAPIVPLAVVGSAPQAATDAPRPIELPPPEWFLFSAAVVGGLLVAKWLLAWFLHSRIATNRLLDHPRRAELVALIEADPGIHFRSLLRLSGQGPGTLAHHLLKLERADLVRRAEYQGLACYFPPQVAPDLVDATILARSEAGQWILRHILESPGVTAKALATKRNVHPSTILHHIRKLTVAGAIERIRTRNGLELRVTQKGVALATAMSGHVQAKTPPESVHV